MIPVPRSSARREAKRGRSRGGRSVRRPQRVLVVTNGEVTETEYCNLLNKEEAQKERGERSFHITCKFKPFDPKRLAEHALGIVADDKKASAKSGGGKSEHFSLVYVIVDVDNMKAENLRAAQSICRSNGMNLVISNPCMEVWLIDHEKACPPGITTAREAEFLPVRWDLRRAGATSTSWRRRSAAARRSQCATHPRITARMSPRGAPRCKAMTSPRGRTSQPSWRA